MQGLRKVRYQGTPTITEAKSVVESPVNDSRKEWCYLGNKTRIKVEDCWGWYTNFKIQKIARQK